MNPSKFSSPRVHYVFGSTSPMVLHPAVHHSQSSCQWYHSCVYQVPRPNLYFILMDNIIHGSWKAGKGWENSSRELMSVRHGLREETMQSVQELLVHFIICLRALLPFQTQDTWDYCTLCNLLTCHRWSWWASLLVPTPNEFLPYITALKRFSMNMFMSNIHDLWVLVKTH